MTFSSEAIEEWIARVEKDRCKLNYDKVVKPENFLYYKGKDDKTVVVLPFTKNSMIVVSFRYDECFGAETCTGAEEVSFFCSSEKYEALAKKAFARWEFSALEELKKKVKEDKNFNYFDDHMVVLVGGGEKVFDNSFSSSAHELADWSFWCSYRHDLSLEQLATIGLSSPDWYLKREYNKDGELEFLYITDGYEVFGNITETGERSTITGELEGYKNRNDGGFYD